MHSYCHDSRRVYVHNATGGILSREKCMQVSEHVGNGTLVPLDDDAFQKQIVLLRLVLLTFVFF